jgi:TonB family protein
MMTGKKKKNISKALIWLFSTIIILVFVGGCLFVIKILISDDGTKRKRQIQMVTLLKPPPPPKIEEKLPEPEIKEKEEILEPDPEEAHEEISDGSEDTSVAGDNLGLDSDGVAGSDGFGLIAKKGGKALIGGDLGNSGLLKQFSWYTQMVQDRIRQYLQKELEKNGGIPEGDLQAIVRIVLDEKGKITKFNIVGSSGSNKMDTAIKTALPLINIEEPPPNGMPKAIKIRVSSKG